jgi:hypothetical protein
MTTVDWWTMIGAIAQLSAVIVGIIGFFFLTWQVHVASKIARADFIIRLESEYMNHHLVTYQKIIVKRQQSLNPQCIEINTGDKTEISEIEHYLSFFANIQILLSEKLIDMKTVDKMFAYRFFTIANDPSVRQIVEPDKEYWELLYELYDEWAKWRNDQGKAIPNSQFPLIDQSEPSLPTKFK